MEHLDKTSIEDMNIEEARGWVLDRFNQIEKYINNIIMNHLEIKNSKKHFMDNIILSSSNMSFGSKIKVLQNIIDSNKLIDNLRKILAIRNGFAHCVVHNQATINKNKENNRFIIEKEEKVINVMSSAGILKTKSYEEYLREFFELNIKIKKELQSLKKEGKI